MGFKKYLSESLIIEAKVKVGGKEFPSKREAAIAMAEAGKNVEFIMKAIGTTETMAKHFVSKYGKKKTNVIAPDKESIDRKVSMLNRLKAELKSAENGSKGKHQSGDGYVLTLKKKIRELEGGVEPKKTQAIERKETLDAYKKGERYKPEPIEPVPLKDTKGVGAKEWMKKQDAIDSSKEVDKKTASQIDPDSKTYKGYTIKKVKTPVASTSPNAKMFGRSGIKHVSEYNVNGFKRNFESMTDAKAAIDRAVNKRAEQK